MADTILHEQPARVARRDMIAIASALGACVAAPFVGEAYGAEAEAPKSTRTAHAPSSAMARLFERWEQLYADIENGSDPDVGEEELDAHNRLGDEIAAFPVQTLADAAIKMAVLADAEFALTNRGRRDIETYEKRKSVV